MDITKGTCQNCGAEDEMLVRVCGYRVCESCECKHYLPPRMRN